MPLWNASAAADRPRESNSASEIARGSQNPPFPPLERKRTFANRVRLGGLGHSGRSRPWSKARARPADRPPAALHDRDRDYPENLRRRGQRPLVEYRLVGDRRTARRVNDYSAWRVSKERAWLAIEAAVQAGGLRVRIFHYHAHIQSLAAARQPPPFAPVQARPCTNWPECAPVATPSDNANCPLTMTSFTPLAS